MFKRIFLAMLPLTMIAVSANADDELSIDLDNITDAEVTLIDDVMDIDVDALSAEAGEESDAEAIEACFRRIGYRRCGWGGYRSWGRCYNHCYNYCRPYFNCHSVRYCAPVYRCVTPVYNYYWGCH